jgi:hypothetical protein
MESWNYHAILPIPEEELEKITDPLEKVAMLSYRKWTEYNDIGIKYDVDPGFFMAAYLQYAQDYKADGLLAHPLMTCRPATYTLLHTRNTLEEKLKVPGVTRKRLFPKWRPFLKQWTTIVKKEKRQE